MPNHVFNEITLHGVDLESSAPLLFNSDGRLSFQTLLPLPINYWPSSSGREHEEAFPGTWLDAARAQWGTKWDAYGDPAAFERDGDTIITFQTAWSMPRGWVCALFNTLKCDITAEWLDEGRSDAFRETFKHDTGIMGDEWKTETIPEGSDDHRRLHLALWGVEEFEDDGHAD